MRIKPPPALIHHLVRGLTNTLHFRLYGLDNLRHAARLSPTGTFLVCHFHQSLLSILGPHDHLPIAALASMSRDGDITAMYLQSIGIRVVRGSSSRGGAFGAFELMKALRAGFHAVINVDGPRGPNKSVKPGPVELARRCGVPMVPIVARATREFSLKRSWDRFRIPLPFSRVAIIYGPPVEFAASVPDARELHARRRRLALSLHALEAQATALVGRSDGAPPRECLAWMDEWPETAVQHPGPPP
jgi:lysophospholipid acyltransferase (LPLAT)-like uncharacterized protein